MKVQVIITSKQFSKYEHQDCNVFTRVYIDKLQYLFVQSSIICLYGYKNIRK